MVIGLFPGDLRWEREGERGDPDPDEEGQDMMRWSGAHSRHRYVERGEQASYAYIVETREESQDLAPPCRGMRSSSKGEGVMRPCAVPSQFVTMR